MPVKGLSLQILASDDAFAYLSCFFDAPERLAAKFMKVSYSSLKIHAKRVWKEEWPFAKIRAGRSGILFEDVETQRDAFLARCVHPDLVAMVKRAKEHGWLQKKMWNPQQSKAQLDSQGGDHKAPLAPSPRHGGDQEAPLAPSPREGAEQLEEEEPPLPLATSELAQGVEDVGAFPSAEDVAFLFD